MAVQIYSGLLTKEEKKVRFLSLLGKLATYFKTPCSQQRKKLCFLLCQPVVQIWNVSEKGKSKDLGTLPFILLHREALCWLACRYTLLLPFWGSSAGKKSLSFDWTNTFQAYQEQKLIWQIHQTKPCTSSQGRGVSKCIISCWESNWYSSFL